MAPRREEKGEGGGRLRVKLLVQRQEPDYALGTSRRDQRLQYASVERSRRRLPLPPLDGVSEDRGAVRRGESHDLSGRLP